MTFTASDGKTFEDRDAYRKYEFALMYTFSKITSSEPLVKPPNSIDGQPFDISDCKGATLAVCDNTDQVQIDNCDSCKIFVAASSESIFVRDCKNCTFTIACKQLRTRDCENCTFYLYSKTEPIIETSSGMKFGPFNGAYDGHAAAMARANLQPNHNLWFAVYDFNDDAKTGKNWRLLTPIEEEPTWCPVGPAENCCPRVAAGSLALPSQGHDPLDPNYNKEGVTQRGGMMSFSLGTSLREAAKLSGDLYTAQETAGKTSATKPVSPKKPQTKTGIGWNPDALGAAEPEPPKPAAAVQKKTSVGWNPGAFDEPAAAPVEPKKKSSIGWNPDAFGSDAPEVPTTNAPLVEKPKQLEEEERDLTSKEVEELLALVAKNAEAEKEMMMAQHLKEVEALKKEIEDLKAQLAAK
jgi:hypothetical protein